MGLNEAHRFVCANHGEDKRLSEFLNAIGQYAFLRHALLAGALASAACGVIGSFVIIRRIVFISGGIAHTVLGGMGIAYWMGADPLYGALIASLVAALTIGLVSLRMREHEDTVIGALWAVGMAVGILFIARAPGYNVDLMSYLFGDILLVDRKDLILIGVLDAAILAVVALRYRQLMAVCFDEEHARLQGIHVEANYLLLLCLIALTVVTLIQVVGLILVIALLTLPAAIAHQYTRSMAMMMLVAVALGFGFTVAGLAVSYQPNLPTGATIVLLAGVTYLASTVGRALWDGWRRRKMKADGQ